VNSTIQTISLGHLALAFIPVAVIVTIMFSWSLKPWMALYATARMLIQLLSIGYVLVFIFKSNHAWIVSLVLTVMLMVASWISLHPVSEKRRQLYPRVLVSLIIGGGLTLAIVTQVVLQLEPWFLPSYMVPLAGMVFANSMNTVSLAAERFESECESGQKLTEAKRIALQTGLIPVTNSMFAVGLVALPGMMTGQILSGVSPLIAVRYQIMVMCMLFGGSGISAACYLTLVGLSRRRQLLESNSDGAA
jgi:putative ABC transport system permease protein